MPTAMLRSGGEEFDVDAFLKALPSFEVENVWRRGSRNRTGKAIETSGFAAVVAESESDAIVIAKLVKFLRAEGHLVRDLMARGASVTVDISLHVGEDEAITKSISFGHDVLGLLAELKVGLQISSYVVSE